MQMQINSKTNLQFSALCFRNKWKENKDCLVTKCQKLLSQFHELHVFSAGLTCPVKACRKHHHHFTTLFCTIMSPCYVSIQGKRIHLFSLPQYKSSETLQESSSRIVQIPNMVKCKVLIFNYVSINIFYSMQRFLYLFIYLWMRMRLRSGDQGWGGIRGAKVLAGDVCTDHVFGCIKKKGCWLPIWMMWIKLKMQ